MKVFIFALCLLLTQGIEALPAQVILIRHAEKPVQGNTLSLKGKERAAALAPYFMESPEVTVYGTPVAIYAQSAPKTDSSVRPIETVTPLALNLKMVINNHYGRDEYRKMIDEIKNNPNYNGKLVLICWEHEVIPEIARAFGTSQSPSRWAGDTYDRCWLLGFQGTRVSFRNLPQKLMFGDSAK